jgi:hypothetical protein
MFKKLIHSLFESPNNAYPGSVSRIGIGSIPTNNTGLQSRCPSFPLQGNQAIHEDSSTSDIQPLILNDISIQGYIVVENGTLPKFGIKY